MKLINFRSDVQVALRAVTFGEDPARLTKKPLRGSCGPKTVELLVILPLHQPGLSATSSRAIDSSEFILQMLGEMATSLSRDLRHKRMKENVKRLMVRGARLEGAAFDEIS